MIHKLNNLHSFQYTKDTNNEELSLNSDLDRIYILTLREILYFIAVNF